MHFGPLYKARAAIPPVLKGLTAPAAGRSGGSRRAKTLPLQPEEGERVGDGEVLQRDLPQQAGLQLPLDNGQIEKGHAGPGAGQGLDHIQPAQLREAAKIPDGQIVLPQRALQHLPGARAGLPDQQPLPQQILQQGNRPANRYPGAQTGR